MSQKQPLRPIMLVGTGSDVGKSWMVTGICRWLKQHGYTPAPFKAQNMSLNSFATPEGLEIGRAQATQAEACDIPCSVEMNPILLKPSSVNQSQIIVNGKPVGNQSAKEYFLGNNKAKLFDAAKEAFHKLNAVHEPVVMEGAGSISEINLKHRDIVNMRMAQAANACVYLVADIDKGGVFGSVYGTIALLEDWEKALLKGIIINKFRGDSKLFEEGRKMMEDLTGYPVLGVIPYDKDIIIEEEDSVALSTRNTKAEAGKLNIAIVHFNYISNYTDFQPFEYIEGINVYYTQDRNELQKADIIILPGTKNTLTDLKNIHENGVASLLKERYGKIPMIGICGGYQMMGKTVSDPHAIESNFKSMEGLGFFDIETTMAKEKRTVQQNFHFKGAPETSIGYEIHMGVSTVPEGKHLNKIEDDTEGYFDGNLSWGTYMHGIFDNASIVHELVHPYLPNAKAADFWKLKHTHFDKLAKLLEDNLDLEKILQDIKIYD